MKKLFAAACMMLAFASAFASEYRLVFPNPPGNGGDIMARAVAEAYTRNTGNSMIVENISGGQQIIAIEKWKAMPGQNSILYNIASNQVFNVVNIPSLPYTDSDFEHVVLLAVNHPIWYTRADSKYKTLQDLDAALKEGKTMFVAADGAWSEANAQVVRKQHPNGNNLDIVSYRSSSEALVHIIGGNLDLGVTAVTPAIIAAQEAGKIRILGVGSPKPYKIGTATVPTVTSALKVPQFEGLNIISVKPGINNAEYTKLRADLITAATDAAVQEKIRNLNAVPVEVVGHDAIMKRLEANRNLLRSVK